jgi:hypothetical protein
VVWSLVVSWGVSWVVPGDHAEFFDLLADLLFGAVHNATGILKVGTHHTT